MRSLRWLSLTTLIVLLHACSSGIGSDNGSVGVNEGQGTETDDDGGVDEMDLCGNGTVDEGEICDIAIPVPQDGCCAFPEFCVDGDPCTVDRVINDGTCLADCDFSEEVAPSGEVVDGCCPSGASNSTDADCSDACGNGVIDDGEACDPGITSGEGVCLDECPPDEGCTTYNLVTADPCNPVCETIEIIIEVDGDGCCPDGSTNDGDSDCPPAPDCEVDADCNDGNECTTNTCTGGECSTSNNDGASCDGGNGTCSGGSCEPNADPCDGVTCDDGNECTTDPACVDGQCPTPVNDDGASCDGGNGTCNGGQCEPNAAPTIAAGTGSTTWTANTTPAGSSGGPTSTGGGCEVFVTALNTTIFIQVDIILDVTSDGANNVTTGWTINAEHFLLPTLGNAAELGSLAVAATVTGATPNAIPSQLAAAAVGALIGDFTTGTVLIVGTPDGVTAGNAALTPTGSSVNINWDGTFSLGLTLGGNPIVDVTEDVCTFDEQGAGVDFAVN